MTNVTLSVEFLTSESTPVGARATLGNGDIPRSKRRPAWLAEVRRDGDRQQMVHELHEGQADTARRLQRLRLARPRVDVRRAFAACDRVVVKFER